jgi:hypothetical protein
MKKKIAKFVLFSFLLSVSLFTPKPTYAGSFWGWETTWEGAGINSAGCLVHYRTEVYNVFGINVSSRTTATIVACPGDTAPRY